VNLSKYLGRAQWKLKVEAGERGEATGRITEGEFDGLINVSSDRRTREVEC